MAIGAGMSCVKYLLFSFNLLFAITGLIILIVGAKAEIKAHPYVDLTDESFYTSAPMILIIVGLIVFIVAFFGCCGAVKENHCMIVTNDESDDGDVPDEYCSAGENDDCGGEPDNCSDDDWRVDVTDDVTQDDDD